MEEQPSRQQDICHPSDRVSIVPRTRRGHTFSPFLLLVSGIMFIFAVQTTDTAMDELQEIKMHIYTFRGRQVLLDRDLAKMYGVEVKRLNESVKRNIKRFPEDFAFILSADEFLILKSQFATSSWGGDRRPPRVFTEQGVAMLSGVLNSDAAIEVNIRIMRAFVAIRQQIAQKSSSLEVLEYRIKRLEEAFEESLRDRNDIDEDTRMRLELIEESLAHLFAEPASRNERIPIKGFSAE